MLCPQIAPLPGCTVALEGQITQTKWSYKNLFQGLCASIKAPKMFEFSGAWQLYTADSLVTDAAYLTCVHGVLLLQHT